jgi:chromate reductase
MSTVKKVGVLIGSLRKESYSRKLAKAAIALAPGSLSFNIIEIGGVSFFNQDLEAEPPAD